MIRNVLDQALANIIGKVAELPVTVKGYTDDVVQQMDERHRAFSQKLEDAISKADAALQKWIVLWEHVPRFKQLVTT